MMDLSIPQRTSSLPPAKPSPPPQPSEYIYNVFTESYHPNSSNPTQACLIASFWSLTEANEYACETARILYECHGELDEETRKPRKKWGEVREVLKMWDGGEEVVVGWWRFGACGGFVRTISVHRSTLPKRGRVM